MPQTGESSDVEECTDGVHHYFMELLSLGLLQKFLLEVFMSANHCNYANEAVNLLHRFNYRIVGNFREYNFLRIFENHLQSEIFAIFLRPSTHYATPIILMLLR